MSKAEGSGFARFHFRLPPSTFLLCCVFAQPSGAANVQIDVSNVGRGTPAQYVKVTGTFISGEARGDDLHIRMREIRLETTGKVPAVSYSALGVAVYQGGKILRASWDFGVRGELTAAKPSMTLAGQTFELPGAAQQCLQAPCEVRLQLRVDLAPDRIHAEHTDFAALGVTRVAAAPKVAPPRAGAKPGVPTGPKPAPRPGVPAQTQQPGIQAGAQPNVQTAPVPQGPPPAPRQSVDKELFTAVTYYIQKQRAAADDYLSQALAISFKGRVVPPRSPLAGLLLYHAAENYEREKNPIMQGPALLWSLEVVETWPHAEVVKALGPDARFDKEIVARRLGDFYWQARRYDRAFEYYDRAYRYVGDLGLQEPGRDARLAFNSAGRMATACALGKWDIADAAMKELKERAARVDASTKQQLDYWIRTGEPRLKARKC